MHPIHFRPPEALRPFIAFYGIWDVPDGFHEPYVSPPFGLSGFIFCLDQVINARLNGHPFMKGPYCATGQVTHPLVGDVIGANRVVMVFMQPFGLHQLFGLDMSLLTNTSMPIAKLMGETTSRKLIINLAEAEDHAGMIAVMNELFLSRFPGEPIDPKLNMALKLIHETKGNISVKDVEAYCFITARSLERLFSLYLGLSPKQYATIFRFKCLVNYIRENPGGDWNTLCDVNGYYDQSHLTRYFTRYLNVKRTEMVRLDMDFISYMLQEA